MPILSDALFRGFVSHIASPCQVVVHLAGSNSFLLTAFTKISTADIIYYGTTAVTALDGA